MTFIPCPNVLQLEALYTQAGQPVENVFHIGGGIISDLSGMANALAPAYAAWEAASGSPIRNTGTIFTGMRIRDLGQQFGQVFDFEGYHTVGTAPTGAGPNNVTLSVKWSTGYAGKANRGRTYHIGFPTAFLSDANTVAPASVTAILAAYNALLTSLNAVAAAHSVAGVGMVVLSRHLNKAPRAAGVTRSIIAATLVDTTVDSQRRRLPFHNRHA